MLQITSRILMKHASKQEDNQEQGFGKCGSQHVYNTIPKSREWLTINYVVNVVGTTLPRFYIFRGEKICDDYIQFCKLGTYMAM